MADPTAADLLKQAARLIKAAAKLSCPIIVPEPRPVVFSGEMAKTKRSTKPHIYWRSGIPGKGATARVLIYTKVCLPDGRITKQNIAHNLGKVTMAEAEGLRDELLAGKAAKNTAPVPTILVEQFINSYHFPYHVATLKMGGRKTAHENLPHFIQALGKRALRSINVIDIQELLNLKATRYSKSTVTKIKYQISSVFRFAMGLGTLGITVNPASLARVPAKCAPTEMPRITPQVIEAQKLRATLANPRYRPLYEMAAVGGTTTLGFAELAELRWHDFNLTGEKIESNGVMLEPYTLYVPRSYYRGEVNNDGKNEGRQRVENLGEQVVEALVALKTRSPFNQADALVFTRTGKHLDYHQALRQLKKACREAGVREFGWKAFRRYCATVLVGKLTEEQRRRMMGHAKIEMTEHYTAENVKARAAAVQEITDELFADPKDEKKKETK